MPWNKYRSIRIRREDMDRIEAELQKLGGMYFTDWATAMSYLSAPEIFKIANKARELKMAEVQRRIDAGERHRETPRRGRPRLHRADGLV